MSDEAVQATNDDASMCKRFAVQQGYWKDPYIQLLVKSGQRRAPEINRGYYARTQGMHTLLVKFIQLTNKDCQVINLGAGFDTLFWRLKDEDLLPSLYVEVDFRAVTSRKCQTVRMRSKLLEGIQATCQGKSVVIENAELHSPGYHIVWGDLRNVAELEEKLTKVVGVDFKKPTFFMSECVLVYLHHDKSAALLKWIASKFPSSFLANYEQVNMGDKFGMVMAENLRARGCTLEGVAPCKDLESQKSRFTSVGWQGAEAADMQTVYASLSREDIYRIERLEFLDETELLDQLLTHYCICWAWKDATNLGEPK
ncbi:leucine carboxyl methyltransferase 1-like [Diadema antillarum]|uniref:leucine carboxyl methyltransferase 1-like n=1 Tax=Diadema antillarum TaxID=105358 RepID=UPI003A8C1D44